jgi:hypothetical protein
VAGHGRLNNGSRIELGKINFDMMQRVPNRSEED